MNAADLAIITALESAGSFSAAARQLNVAHTTVSRKLRELEKHFGTLLADRRDDGVVLTPEGERLAQTARRIEAELVGVEKAIAGRDHSLTGHITLTTVDVLAWHFLPTLSVFRQRHSNIELTVEVGTEVRSLSRRQAEVALRLTNAPDEHLFGRRLGQLEFYPYVHESLVGSETLPWLEYGNRDCSQPAARWLRKTHPLVQPQTRLPTPLIMLRAVEAGLGAGLVPSALADAVGGLERLSDEPAFTMDIWLLAPMELRQTARIRALFEAFTESWE